MIQLIQTCQQQQKKQKIIKFVFWSKPLYIICINSNNMYPENTWPYIEQLCNQTNSFITTKTGLDLHLLSKCLKLKELIHSNLGLIAIGIILILIILVSIKVLQMLNSRTKVFQATLVSVKEVTYDSKVFTFDLPAGWNRIGLNIGEHLTLT